MAQTTTETQPFCENCLTGFSFTGTPQGQEKKIGPFNTVYISSGDESGQGKPAIVLLTDIFGLGLVNPKLIADKLHEGTGWAVYVPDLFNGNPVAADAVHLPDTPEELRAQTIGSKLKGALGVAVVVPWFIRNRPATKTAAVISLLEVLKGPEYGHTKIGTIGYCYGGKICATLNVAGLSDATSFCHPSMMSKSEIASLKKPATFALAEEDSYFDESMVSHTHDTLKDKIPYEINVYPGTCHGFAARGNLAIESVHKGFDGALVQSINWYKKHLS